MQKIMETKYKEPLPKKFIVIHSSFTKPNEDIGVTELTRKHRMNNLLTIGYHYVIRRDGLIEHGRPLSRVGNHTEGHNHHSVGICVIGGVDKLGKPDNNYTPAQFKILKWLLNDLHGIYPDAKVVGHKELNSHTSCPNFSVKAWLSKIK